MNPSGSTATVETLTYLGDQMEEELLRVLLLIRAELRMALPNEILEHLGADAGLGALLPQQLLLHPPVRRVGDKNPPKITINILLFLKVRDFRILCGKIS